MNLEIIGSRTKLKSVALQIPWIYKSVQFWFSLRNIHSVCLKIPVQRNKFSSIQCFNGHRSVHDSVSVTACPFSCTAWTTVSLAKVKVIAALKPGKSLGSIKWPQCLRSVSVNQTKAVYGFEPYSYFTAFQWSPISPQLSKALHGSENSRIILLTVSHIIEHVNSWKIMEICENYYLWSR